jgi:hypothetical protein
VSSVRQLRALLARIDVLEARDDGDRAVASTWPRYIVSGVWRCLFIWMVPRGPSKLTSAKASITGWASVVPAFSTASL